MLFQRVFIRKYHIQSCFWSACCTLSNLVSSFYQKAFVLTNVRNKKEKNSFYRIFLNLWIMRFDAVFSLFLFWHVMNTRTNLFKPVNACFYCIYGLFCIFLTSQNDVLTIMTKDFCQKLVRNQSDFILYKILTPDSVMPSGFLSILPT